MLHKEILGQSIEKNKGQGDLSLSNPEKQKVKIFPNEKFQKNKNRENIRIIYTKHPRKRTSNQLKRFMKKMNQ